MALLLRWPRTISRRFLLPRWPSPAKQFSRWVSSLHSVVAPPGWRSSSGTEVITIPCGSGEPVCVFLHNMKMHFDEDAPLVVYIPPNPTPIHDSPTAPELPPFLRGLSVATIAYRWFPSSSRLYKSPLTWPAPAHDMGFAWKWIFDNLRPTNPQHSLDPRHQGWDITAVGAYQGAGLAIGLALHGCIPRPEFGIRRVLAYNGIYNWSMFLPQHRINRPPTAAKELEKYMSVAGTWRQLGDAQLLGERTHMAGLFDDQPVNMFDPFASPSLFFHTEDITIPRFFDPEKEEDDDDKDLLWSLARESQPPRRAALFFPPFGSALRIPDTQLFYTPLLRPPELKGDDWGQKMKVNCYEAQARALARWLRQGVHRMEVAPLKLDPESEEGIELSKLPFFRVQCESLTDLEYPELGLHENELDEHALLEAGRQAESLSSESDHSYREE